MTNRTRLLVPLCAVVALLGAARTADAATCTWTGLGGNNLWTTGANWAAGCGAAGPVSGDDIVFPANAAQPVSNNPTANIVVASLQIIGAGVGNVAYEIQGATLYLDGNVTIDTGGQPAPSIDVNMILNDNVAIAVNGAGTASFGHVALFGFVLTIDTQASGSAARMESGISGAAGGVAKLGPGTLWLPSPSPFGGNLHVVGGSVQVLDPNGLGANGPGNATIVCATCEVLFNFLGNANIPEPFVLNGHGPAGVGNIRADAPEFTLSGEIQVAAPASIGVPLDHRLTLSGLVTGSSLGKRGAGSLFLGGPNTHSGSIVEAGFLFVNGNQPASPVDVPAGVLGGTGTAGQVTATGGVVAPGLSPGLLSTADFSLGAASTFSIELDGPVAGVSYDQVNVAGTVALNGATLDVSVAFVPLPGAAFVIVSNDGVDAVGGEFAGLAHGQIVNLDGLPFHIDYAGGDGNDVVLSFAPNGVPTMPVYLFVVLMLVLAAIAARRLRGRELAPGV